MFSCKASAAATSSQKPVWSPPAHCCDEELVLAAVRMTEADKTDVERRDTHSGDLLRVFHAGLQGFDWSHKG